MQTVEPGWQTPVHYPDCETVIDTLKGAGQISIEDKIIKSGPDHTAAYTPVVHQLVNRGVKKFS